MSAPGAIIGTAGGSLNAGSAGWAANADVARVGQRGEQRTARVLNALALQPGGPTVLHDLRIPIPGFSANIDHAVISGSDVTLLDSKSWKPGFYWTLGATRRGLTRFPFADKRTLPTAVSAIAKHLQRAGVSAHLRPSLLVIWPSSPNGSTALWAYHPQSAVAVTGGAFERCAARRVGTRSADPRVVAALRSLVH